MLSFLQTIWGSPSKAWTASGLQKTLAISLVAAAASTSTAAGATKTGSEKQAATTSGASGKKTATHPKPATAIAKKRDNDNLRFVWDSLSAIRNNPRGLIANIRFGPQLRLFKKPGILFRDSSVRFLFATDLTPAYHRVGGAIVLTPLTVLSLWVRYDHMISHGLFSYTQSFRSPIVDFSDSATEANAANNYVSKGSAATVGGLFQAQVGPIATRIQYEAIRISLDLRNDDRVFYDGYIDLPFPNDGWGSRLDADLIWLHKSGFKLGVRYTTNQAFYRDHHFRAGEDRGDPTIAANHRVGPAFLYTFFEGKNPRGVTQDPTLALLVQWWLQHPYRAGQRQHQAYPYMLLAFLQHGDI